ncbi:MAG: hypothetical protein MJZ62_07530 [Bacteroidales bacterium]|nr:hypothetical protein [Bacteroidales bacterium]
MSGIGVTNIPELRQFGGKLNMAGDALTNLITHLANDMHHACDNWEDGQARTFMEELERSKSEIDKISQQMQQFSRYITRYCDKLEEASNIRI